MSVSLTEMPSEHTLLSHDVATSAGGMHLLLSNSHSSQHASYTSNFVLTLKRCVVRYNTEYARINLKLMFALPMHDSYNAIII